MSDISGSAGVPAGTGEKADEDVGAPEGVSGSAGVPAGLGGQAGVPAGTGGEAGEDAGAPGGGNNRRAEWYSRGYLPHRDLIGLHQSITFRLADSLPREKLRELDAELERLPPGRRDAERRVRIEQWLDAGSGCCALAHPAVAEYVENALLHFDGDRYRLLAWCVMPNHVHVLAECRRPLPDIVQGWKSFTARWALRRNDELRLGVPDPKHFWMREYWDRYIRDENHLAAVIAYIHDNPVKAGLCRHPAEWRWSSAAATRADGSAGVPAGFLLQAGGDAGAPRGAGAPGKSAPIRASAGAAGGAGNIEGPSS